ncbi:MULTISPECIES: GGDEF domain-containing protein [Vibrio]|uniref:GGDEF domain-containing protein n=1 Tax=Vibrio TaxID=662 RepID=UPI0003B1D111|nr:MULTISPECIES: GGDEF domain-containing protein [Vibrio]UAB73112.1 GGDEF domain-containing protein [Vibrio sp. SCSIO 43132]CCN72120.1 putative GGDEF family protein [Vibrio nigripulchritudo SFn118]
MYNMAGRKLEEMADVRLLRRKRTIVVLSVIVFILLSVFGFLSISHGDHFQGSVNYISALVIFSNLALFLSRGHYTHAAHVLTIVLITHAIVLILTGGLSKSSVYWIYPILATIIFVNSVRSALIATVSFYIFCIVAFTSPNFPYLSADYSEFSVGRFLTSMMAFLAICHYFAYQYCRTNHYVLSLYQEGIEDLAYRDALTGLANRWSFEKWAEPKLKELRNSNKLTALVFVDIDNFKEINDNYGHAIGDKVLQSFGQRLANNLRTKNRKDQKDEFSIARYAGDEFVILLYDVPDSRALDSILHRIMSLFNDGYQVNNQVNYVTLSVGVSIYGQDAMELPELLRCADKAMYAAKCVGKNGYEYYHNVHNAQNTSSNVKPFKRNRSKEC